MFCRHESEQQSLGFRLLLDLCSVHPPIDPYTARACQERKLHRRRDSTTARY